jgi:signal transduction histidine kinase/ligand-binding sensor domain-containing protein
MKCFWPLMLFCAAAPSFRGSEVSRQSWDTESGLPQNTVQAILQTRDGYLWFATEGGLARFDNQTFAVFNSKNTPALRSNDVRALLEDEQGTLWIATADGVAALFHQRFRAFTTDTGLPSNSVSRLFEDSSRRVCAQTAAGAACLEGNRFVSSASEKAAASLPPANLQQFVSSPVLCSYIDREGNIWIGTESTGVTILRKLYFQSFSDRAEGLDDQVRCVYRDHAGFVWFGTNSQGLTRSAAGVFSRITAAQGLSSNVIVSLGEDSAGDLLVGTPDGLNRLHNQHVTVITSSDGLPDDFIRSIHTDSDGTVWIGTRHGLAKLRDGHFQTYTHADGLGSDLIGSLTRDHSGNLWVATLAGLSRFDGTHFKNFTTADGLFSNIITALYFDSENTLWIGTQGGGLDQYAGGVFQHVRVAGVPDVIYGITEDRHGDLWLASDTGIVRLRLHNAEAVTYGVSDGLRVNECSGGGHPGVARAQDGGIWFATLKGAVLLRPGVAFSQLAPPVAIESVAIDSKVVTGESSLEIPPGPNRLVFRYAGLSFLSPQKIDFRYRLEGFDKNWVEAGNARSAFYTNLSPGRYTFRVIARSGDGVWNNEGAALAIHIQPHFYQTWWFAALMLLPFAAAGYGIYRWRVARVQAAMESRFEAVLGERNRIAREIHDTLAQGFAGISVQLELVSRQLDGSSTTVRKHLDQARMLVRSSLAEARRSIWELRSQSSEMEDLASRLSKMAAQMGASGQPKIALQVRGTYRPLPARTEDELLRIAQEAVTNSIRHAEASLIDLELAFDPRLLRMTIADNGKGFSPNGAASDIVGHFGLQGMRERAAGIDAKLSLKTAPGAGTRLSVEVVV